MPTISHFYGISIRMYYDEHGQPHFHAYYGEYSAVIAIETLIILEGFLTRRASAMVLEWANEHRDELLENWGRAKEHEPLMKIAPLS